ncbi:transposase [Streptomyces sp. NPDC056638]|uniref:transposase n=1 Tax=Streptomyces sp. NPDC056638 TaxID=3345887 RepID=UPI003681A819
MTWPNPPSSASGASCSRSGATTRSSPTPPRRRSRPSGGTAVVEQVIADSKASALAHLPSGHFHANAAWLTQWAMAYNLLRAAGALTSAFHAKATTATLRAHLVQVPARIARSARRVTLHLPRNWRWQKAWTHLFDTVHRPPEPA